MSPPMAGDATVSIPCSAKLIGDRFSELRSHCRSLQRDRALQIDRTVQPARQDEVSFEQRARSFECFQHLSLFHS